MSGFSWVTLATNDSYSLGALVLAHSLKRVGTAHQLVVMVTPGVTQPMREKLRNVFDLVFEVNILDSKDERNLLLLQRPELGITFTKLHCWRLTQYQKCVFLDADTLVLQNCDELFDRDEFSAAPDVGWPDCFNSGVFVYKPSDETFNSLLAFALERGSFDGGDQGLLNLYFSDWAHKDISKHLPFIYNMCSTACYSYLPAFKQYGENVKIVHFIGNSKPWLQYFNSENLQVSCTPGFEHLQLVFEHWWNLFCSHVHSGLQSNMGGLAGAFAQMTLREPRSASQGALEEHLRRQGWEAGRIDYLGQDSFDNVWKKICETMSAAPKKEPSPPKQIAAPVPIPVADVPVAEPAVAQTPAPASEPVSAAAPAPAAEPVPVPLADASVPTPTADPVAELAATQTPAPEPVAVSAPEPVIEPVTPVPAAESTPTPESIAAPEPVAAPTPVSVAPSVPAPVAEPVPAPAVEQASVPTSADKPIPISATEPAATPAAEQAVAPVTEHAVLPPTEQVAAPTTEQAAAPSPAPAAEQAAAPSPAPAAEQAAAPSPASATEQATVPSPTPAADQVVASSPAPAAAPVLAPAAEPVTAVAPTTTAESVSAPASAPAAEIVSAPAPAAEQKAAQITESSTKTPKEVPSETKSAEPVVASIASEPPKTETKADVQKPAETPVAKVEEAKPAEKSTTPAATEKKGGAKPKAESVEGQSSESTPVPPPRKSGKNGGATAKKTTKKK